MTIESETKDELPSELSIKIASKIKKLLQPYLHPEFRQAHNGDRGLVLEFGDGELFETIEITQYGGIEYCRFRNSKLTMRFPLDIFGLRNER